MADNPMKNIAQKIDELIALCRELNRENQLLKSQQASWQREKQSLIDKNELARAKIEAMISRLRTLEQSE